MKLKVPRSALLAMLSVATTGLVTAGFVRAQSVDQNSTIDQPITSTTTTVATTPSTPPPSGQFDPTVGGHVGANGVKEVLLTGDTATEATAAALAAVPGGTIIRVETDAEGATYEAHMTKPDGSTVTVKMDANFTVTSTESGMGGPH